MPRTYTPQLLLVLLFSAAILPFGKLIAQENPMDSLREVIRTTSNDSTKIKAYLQLGVRTEAINFDSAMSIYDTVYAIARDADMPTYMGNAQFYKAFAYRYRKASEECFPLLYSAIENYRKTDVQENLVNAIYTAGTFWADFEQYDSSIHYLQMAAEESAGLSDSILLGKVYNNLGLIYQYVGIYDLSIDATIKAVHIKSKTNADVELSLINLGLSYLPIDDHEGAIRCFKDALEISEQNNDSVKIALCLKNIGDCYLELNEPDSALHYFKQSQPISESLNDSNSIAHLYLAVGKAINLQGDIYKARKTLLEGLTYFPSELGSKRLLGYFYLNLAEYERKLVEAGHPEISRASVIKNAKKALILGQETSILTQQKDALNLLFVSSKEMNDYRAATEYAYQMHLINDTLLAQERISALTEQQIRFETEIKEQEIEALNRENELKSTSLRQSEDLRQAQKQIIMYLSLAAAILLALVSGIWYLYNERIKVLKELKKQNVLIRKQKEEKEVLLREIHHRVKNNMQMIIALLQLQDDAIDSPEFTQAVEMSHARIHSMAKLHEILYQHKDVGKFDFQGYLKALLEMIKESSHRTSIETIIKLSPDLEIELDDAIPLGLIITELATNSIKYANPQDELKIYVELIEDESHSFVFKFADNGQGLPDGWRIGDSSSLGLRLVEILSQQLRAKLEYQNSPGAEYVLRFERGS